MANLARNIQLQNNTDRTLEFGSVNSAPQAPPREIQAHQPGGHEDARYGGVAYTIKGDNNALATWIVAWSVAQTKVYTKILGPNGTFNWSDIYKELDERGGNPYTGGTAYGFKSEAEIVRDGCSVGIRASLSTASSA